MILRPKCLQKGWDRFVHDNKSQSTKYSGVPWKRFLAPCQWTDNVLVTLDWWVLTCSLAWVTKMLMQVVVSKILQETGRSSPTPGTRTKHTSALCGHSGSELLWGLCRLHHGIHPSGKALGQWSLGVPQGFLPLSPYKSQKCARLFLQYFLKRSRIYSSFSVKGRIINILSLMGHVQFLSCHIFVFV